uniref:Uncharacterized protein n=1 Tax=Timema shepardi TaxID=629360 RepID=A0A7R9FZR4_TIMSH|nr:unnamed protein product [Timema shepardi]
MPVSLDESLNKDFNQMMGKNLDNSEDKKPIDVGTCSLHTVHGAYKTAHNKCEWQTKKATLETVNKLEAEKIKLIQQAEEEASALQTEINVEKKRLRQISPMASLVLTDSSQLTAFKSYQTKLRIPTLNQMICKNMYGSYEDYDEGTADYYDTTESYPVFAVCLSALLLADETTNRWKGFKTPSSGVATDRSRFRPTPYARPAKSAGKVLSNKLADTRGENGKYPEMVWTKWPKVQDHFLFPAGKISTNPEDLKEEEILQASSPKPKREKEYMVTKIPMGSPNWIVIYCKGREPRTIIAVAKSQ